MTQKNEMKNVNEEKDDLVKQLKNILLLFIKVSIGLIAAGCTLFFAVKFDANIVLLLGWFLVDIISLFICKKALHKEQNIKRSKNKLEILVVILCCLLGGIAMLLILISGLLIKDCVIGDCWAISDKLSFGFYLTFALIPFFTVYYAFAELGKTGYIHSKYYRNFLIMLWLILGGFALMWKLANQQAVIDMVKPEKPIIYLYPNKKTEVNVVVGKPENLKYTYPEYNAGWRVTAEPNGLLTDQNGRHYYALYWEGKNLAWKSLQEGFVVKREDTISFLEEKLALLGLSEREANEFIIYWLPRLQAADCNFIQFETKTEIDTYMPLYITPQPNTIIRVMMKYRVADDKERITPQQLPPTPKREGFVVVEWGGIELEKE